MGPLISAGQMRTVPDYVEIDEREGAKIVTDVRLPWGGARDSGLGREHGDAAIGNFTESKAIWLALN